MKNCKKCTSLIFREQEGTLTPEETAFLKAHLSLCLKCQKEKRLVQSVFHTLQEEKPGSLPQGFHQELMKKVKAEAEKKTLPEIWLKRPAFGYAVTACLALALTIYGFSGHFGSKDPLPIEAEKGLGQEKPSSQALYAGEPTDSPPPLQEEEPQKQEPLSTITATPAPTPTPIAPKESAEKTPEPPKEEPPLQEDPPEIEPDAQPISEPPASEEPSLASEEPELFRMASGAEKAYSHSVVPITIQVQGEVDLSHIEGVLISQEGVYQIPMTEYQKVLTLLKEMEYEVENPREDLENVEWFLLVMTAEP